MSPEAISRIQWKRPEGVSWDTLGLNSDTPLVVFDRDPLTLYAKLEYLLPGGSVKSRIALPLVRSLLDEGSLTRRTEYVVEATGGNTAFALIDALRMVGSRAKVLAVATDKIDERKIRRLRDRGAIVRRIPYEVASAEAGGQSPLLTATAAIALETPNSVLAGQFTARANPEAHRATTAQEIMVQLPQPPDAVVLGAGSGGTIVGLATAFRDAGYPTRIVLADPQGSVIAPLFHGLVAPKPSKTIVQGIGGDVKPPLLSLDLIDEAITVADEDTIRTWRDLARDGFSVGLSSACAVTAALMWADRRSPRRTRCVVLFADHGSRYQDQYPSC
jgi:cystathionine beta-synthase